LKVPKGKGEQVRKKLLETDLLDISLKVRREGDQILFPVISEEAAGLGYDFGEEEFEERELAESDYKGTVEVPDALRPLLPTSFDVVGDVAIIKLPEDLLPYAKGIGDALRRTFPRLRTIALDKGVKGELRVRDLEVIAGGPGTETKYTEHGVKLIVDPAKIYFNPRLSNERRRISALVRPGEVVIDMFAGAGPFAIMIAKHSAPEVVYAIDLNPDAVEFMRRNVDLNRAEKVVPIEGDAREVIFLLPCADRIIMNLPHSAMQFLHDALTRLNLKGTIHMYHICDRSEIDTVVEGLITEARGTGIKLNVARKVELKTYSPSMSVFSLDLVLADRS
jgi:tRNA (guanine37-N1)-methyltransferase